MALTKSANSKANIKQYSNADLPVNPKQPVLNRYAAESSLNQTVITLPFQVDTVNAADGFLLSVDGKVLTPGASNDYQFSAVDSFGFSNSITLTAPIPGGMNIQAIKLGLKKEIEFAQDARFSALYESQEQALQGFIRTTDLMAATSAIGTPNTGSFYSAIVNRASLPEMRQDLRVRMGIERVMTQQLSIVANEFGPNGELISMVPGEDRIRLVGTWVGTTGTYGQYCISSVSGDYVEITFYGTGLNLLTDALTGTRDLRVSIDGGAEGSNILTASTSDILGNRNYSKNTVVNAVSNIAQGVHTAKIRSNNSNGFTLFGFEVLNETSSLRVNPGSSYLSGKKATTIAQQTLAHNASFESGTLGTRGGRVLVYQKADSSIAKAVQPVNASQANLTSTDHANEDIVRNIHWKEFGSGRSDDFSLSISTSGANYAFTLDDGTTSLVGGNVFNNTTNNTVNCAGVNAYLVITFIGTGLDILRLDDASGIDTHTVTVDGVSIGNLTAVGVANRPQVTKIVSGLPYGTHVVKITRTTAVPTGTVGIRQLLVYQPKKPTLPAGAVELADYNVMADYVANATGGLQTIGTGVLRKSPLRENLYVGTWTVGTDFTNSILGNYLTTAVASDYVEYSFFVTGFEYRFSSGTSATTIVASVDGSANLSGFSTSSYGASIASFTPSTGTLVANTTAANGNGLRVSGLSLGFHKLRLTKSGAANMFVDCLDIVTPIHAYKLNSAVDLQNTLSVGSNAIADTRSLSAVKQLNNTPKVLMAVGVVANPSLTSATLIPMPDMSLTYESQGEWVELHHAAAYGGSAGTWRANFAFFVNGVQKGPTLGGIGSDLNGGLGGASGSVPVYLPKGTHKLDVYWSGGGSGMSAHQTNRIFTAKKLN